MNTNQARTNMLTQQIRACDVLDQAVLDVIAAIPREDFVPAQYREVAFADMQIPLAHGQKMLTPKEEAGLLQAAAIKKTDIVLEIGTGTGFMTALLARMAKQVYSVDIFADFTAQAQHKLDALSIKNATLVTADAARGWQQQAPYDVIFITGSLPFLPDDFRTSLKPGGRMIAILGKAPAMEAVLITRDLKNNWSEKKLFETVVQPLLHALQPSQFTF